MAPSERQALIDVVRRMAYREGDFVLASGRRSNYLVDVKRAVLNPRGGWLIGRALLAEVRAHFPSAEGAGGRTLGADPLAVCLAQASLHDEGRPIDAFIVRKEAKSHGSAGLLEVSAGLRLGAPVVVLEDTVTTGGSSMKAVGAVRDAGFDVLGVLTLIDREEGGRQLFDSHDLPFRSVLRVEELAARAG